MKRSLPVVIGVILGVSFAVYLAKGGAEKSQRVIAYIKKHQCVRDGFAGRDAMVVYRCDTGPWLEKELPYAEKQEQK